MARAIDRLSALGVARTKTPGMHPDGVGPAQDFTLPGEPEPLSPGV